METIWIILGKEVEGRIDIKDIKDWLPEFRDQTATLTLRLETWVTGWVLSPK